MKTFLIARVVFWISIRLSAQPSIGIAQDLDKDSIVHEAGYSYLVASLAKYVSPRNVSEEMFKINTERIKNLKTPLYGFNFFIPAELKLVGKAVDEKAILAYTEIVFQRCKILGVKLIVWGSGGARRVPEGFNMSVATQQFIDIARKIATVAARYSVVIAVENLNSTETNFINTLEEVYNIIKKVNHPNLRLCADIYHILKENESPAIIEKAGKLIVHCDLAEKEQRTPPGVKGDDFKPYFMALKKIKYKGVIILECQWENLSLQGNTSRKYLEGELNEVYH